MGIDTGIKSHTCGICHRPRSDEFHRRYPAGQGYPRTHSICRRCRQEQRGVTSKSHEQPVCQTTPKSKPVRRSVIVAVKTICRALMSGNGLDIHVHHHHWHHSNGDDGITKEKKRLRPGSLESTGKRPMQVAELADGPAPLPCELPAYQELTYGPSQSEQKPVFRFHVTEYI
ncbi:hypothetical protein FOXG_16052 [Fusarium oxysporum f. sp. lycopersici 4287]|uniref:Uncharacterized protein n=2 Tax=Fusarium oxysporum TaxID=5507 RepID=A0A0J9W5P6_FUSO4|nr:uncharacterized protein FOXG_16052 [Fusarium oxysporum f. sp. lycopersici 4287]KNB18379.1 hypothetical protein FOXG_16052 [Fusarium oxysporum f. sp. lycopersici 4287]